MHIYIVHRDVGLLVVRVHDQRARSPGRIVRRYRVNRIRGLVYIYMYYIHNDLYMKLFSLGLFFNDRKAHEAHTLI